MTRRISLQILVSFAMVFNTASAMGQGRTNSLVVPRERAERFGRDIGFMFGGYHFQQLYSPLEFTNGPVDVVAITGMAFRWDEQFTGSFETIGSFLFKVGVTAKPNASFYENLPNPVTVVSTNGVHLFGGANRTAENFELVFPFREPFVYDRRLGWLVVEGSVLGGQQDVDAEFGEGTRGFFRFQNIFAGQVHSRDSILVTEFSYTVMPIISSITVQNGILTIELTADSELPWIFESSSRPSGPFKVESDAQISGVSDFILRVVVPAKEPLRFYRFRSEKT